jgi:hypothetical protein
VSDEIIVDFEMETEELSLDPEDIEKYKEDRKMERKRVWEIGELDPAKTKKFA